MEFFWDTIETIPSGVGFSYFDSLHLGWLGVLVVTAIACCIWYKNLNTQGRNRLKKCMALSMIIMEFLKIMILAFTGRFYWCYLPLHLCGINIFVVLTHAWKQTKALDNFLYFICIPGALAALLFPGWTSLPLQNIYHIHSYIVHILLILYPLIQTVNGNLDLDVKSVPKCLGALVLIAIPIYGLNLLLDTNFMFLMWADPENPLAVFEQMWGSHLLGFPVIIAAVVVVMYLPIVARRKKYKENPKIG